MSDSPQEPENEPKVTETRGDAERATHRMACRSLVVIGASAGGLQSLEAFFELAPTQAGLGYVVIQHMSAKFESVMDELLGRRTEMIVKSATSGALIEPDHVLIVPPGQQAIVRSGALILEPLDRTEIPSHPIDRLFSSAAGQAGDETIAIILSGTGTDGTKGAIDVRSAGGLVFAEAEASAKFHGMPGSAIAAGATDEVYRAGDLAQLLGRLKGNRLTTEPEDLPEEGVQKVRVVLQTKLRTSFASFKDSTLRRRISRRMLFHSIDALDEYVTLLQEDDHETDQLAEDLLISVTRFFRDPHCFRLLEEDILPKIVADKPRGAELRIWCAGCASGEEAYSIAMLALEAIKASGKDLSLRVYGSDLKQDALDFGAAAIYPAERMIGVDEDRRSKHFLLGPKGFTAGMELQQSVVFLKHDLLFDAPFSHIDVALCRNLLIYLEGEAQRTALSRLDFALRMGGHLFLGPSESVRPVEANYRPVSDAKRVYVKTGNKRFGLHRATERLWTLPHRQAERPVARRSESGMDSVYDQLLDRFMPDSVLVDESLTILERFGRGDQLLGGSRNLMGVSLLELLSPEAGQQLLKEVGDPTQRGASKRMEGFRPRLASGEELPRSVEIHAVHGRWSTSSAFLIEFVGLAKAVIPKFDSPEGTAEAIEADRVARLQRDLNSARASVMGMVEQLETSNEELQATNEELVSSNEELQSTNEELNSVNEELYTINAEYQAKITELRELSEDMGHLMSVSSVGLLFLDEDLRIRRFTDRIAEFFNLERQDIGRVITSFRNRLNVPEMDEVLMAAAREGVTWEREVVLDDGRSLLLRALPYRQGEVNAGAVLALSDVTSLAEARAMAVRHREELQRLIDSLPLMVSYVDSEQRYLYVNQRVAHRWGKTAEELVGHRVEELLGDGYGALEAPLTAALSGEPQQFEVQAEGRDGSVLEMLVDYVPSADADGTVRGVFIQELDITSRKEVEHELDLARREAEIANRTKSQFLANMSHELRTPMSAILGYAELLSREVVTQNQRDHLDVIRRNGEYLVEIINDILDLSKVESDQLDLSESAVDLGELFRDVLAWFGPRAEERQLELSLVYDTEVPARSRFDARRMRQVLINVIGNAIKFTARGGVRLRVRCVGGDDARLLLNVVDTGIGFSKDEAVAILEPFVQGTEVQHRGFEGSGLGLAITGRLVDAMGGELRLRSKEHFGTRVTVELPLNADPIASWYRPELGARRVPDFERDPGDLKLEANLLVVDDSQDLRQLAKQVLEAAGSTVTEAGTGLQALEQVEAAKGAGRPFDAIVLDMQMPEMDGYETVRRLRAAGEILPILALTAGTMKGDREKALAAGCDGFLSKPFHGGRLLALLEVHVRRHKLQLGPSRPILLIEDDPDSCEALRVLLELEGRQVSVASDSERALELASDQPELLCLLDYSVGGNDLPGFAAALAERLSGGAGAVLGLSGSADGEARARQLGLAGFIAKPVEMSDLVQRLQDLETAHA